jgi:hypothetical protein
VKDGASPEGPYGIVLCPVNPAYATLPRNADIKLSRMFTERFLTEGLQGSGNHRRATP